MAHSKLETCPKGWVSMRLLSHRKIGVGYYAVV